MKLWWSLILVLGVTLSMMAITARAESDMWEEDDDGKEVLVRTVRGTKERGKKCSFRIKLLIIFFNYTNLLSFKIIKIKKKI